MNQGLYNQNTNYKNMSIASYIGNFANVAQSLGTATNQYNAYNAAMKNNTNTTNNAKGQG